VNKNPNTRFGKIKQINFNVYFFRIPAGKISISIVYDIIET